MLDQLISIVTVVVIALAAYGVGSPVLRGLGVGREDRLSAAVWSLAVGLIAAGTGWAALGLLGVLYLPMIGLLTLPACSWGVAEIIRGYAGKDEEEEEIDVAALEVHRVERPVRAPWPDPPKWIIRGVLLLAGLACLGSLIAALAPPTAGDALCYHLELPKTFLAEHSIGDLPYSENSTFPLLVEMWYLWGLAVDGPVTAGLIHWGMGILLGLATVLLATPIIGRPWAWVAGAVVLLVPGVNNQMTAPLNDVALALMTTLAVAAWWRAVVNEEGRRWFVLAGLAAGGALGTKYVAGLFAAAMAASTVWVFCRRPQQRRLLAEGAAIVAVVAVSVGGLWYIRAAWYRGNPVYPLFNEILSRAEAPGTDDFQTLPASKSPLGRTPWGAATAAWHVTMHPERFGGRGHQLGVVLLATLPGILFTRRLRGLGILLGVAAAYWLVWYLLRQNVRFLLPAVPLVAVAVVWTWIEIRRFPTVPRRVVGAALAGMLVVYAAVGMARGHDRLAVALGLEGRQQYLTEHEPTWAAAEVANQIAGPEAHLLSQDYRGFYFNCRVTRENVYRRRTGYDRQITDPAGFSRRLRRAGFTHLLLAENLAGSGIRYDPTLSRLADAQWATGDDDSLVKLTEYRFRDSDGAVRRYRLVMLR